jgi:serine-type D-Ala-D-Ala carboxypeptidase/endopeptidase (penicillin-binding protein 4)
MSPEPTGSTMPRLLIVKAMLVSPWMLTAALIALGPASAAPSPTAGAELLHPLPEPYVAALQAAQVPAGSAALVVVPLGGSGISFAANAERPLNPASTMKLVTTYAALHLLGPDYRWRTDALTAAPLQQRTLRGDLVLRGSGDPSLVLERFWLLLQRLRGLGIDRIDGDLILDRLVFSTLAADPAAFDGAPERPYNVGPDALLVNYKAVALTFVPDDAAQVARVFASPPLAGLAVPATVPLLAGSCGNWTAKLQGDLTTPLAPVFRGGFPSACGERNWYLSMLDHPSYVGATFRGLWEASGGQWNGELRDITVPVPGRVLATHESPPLSQIVRDINKFSNNVMTRQLFLTLGAVHGGSGSDVAAAIVIADWLGRRGIAVGGLVIDNGAGLSRSARLRPAMLAELLVDAWHDPRMPEFVASLPIVGVDGTTRSRGSRPGTAHIKTGMLNDVRAIAGYVHAASGRRYAVVAIVNHRHAQRSDRAHDALLDWLYDNG